MEDIPQWNPEILNDLVRERMPFGKYKGYLICDLPDFYLEYFLKKGGFPKGKLGQWMSTMYEIKLNGLEYLLLPKKKILRPK